MLSYLMKTHCELVFFLFVPSISLQNVKLTFLHVKLTILNVKLTLLHVKLTVFEVIINLSHHPQPEFK